MNLSATKIMTCALLAGSTCAGEAIVSSLWEDYKIARLSGLEPELADFSYVGYHTGRRTLPEVSWEVFNVVDFGAIPDDGISDRNAVIAAITAAEDNGSGIVYFPGGRFRLNDISDPHNQPIRITSSNIVLRGSGSGSGGTELFFERHMDPADPKKIWTSPFSLQISGKGRTEVISRVIADAQRETFSVKVEKPAKFQSGDWILLSHKDNSPEAIAPAVAPYPVDPHWTALTNEGLEILEIHRIKAIEGNNFIFMEPIHTDVKAENIWKVSKLEMLEEMGVEDIAFVGNWQDDFVHHKDAIHDGGWSCLELKNCVNSWIRDCRFTDLNRVTELKGCSSVTVQDITLTGTPGHNAISLKWTSHSLVQRVDDRASHWHANGVSEHCSGNVFLKSNYTADTCYEAHSSQPRWTLMDNISGGWMYGRWGGALHNQPNHLEGLIFWNYRNTGTGEPGLFHFMLPDDVYGRIIMPYVIGFHGNPQEWVEEEIKVLESNGAPVYPESLYEAQLWLRIENFEH